MKKILLFYLILPSLFIHGQTQIRGRVISESNEPLPGASVLVKGTGEGTITNFDGYYTINVSESDAILVFSYVGYNTEEIQVGDKTKINIQLLPNLKNLDEVVVVGYGTQKKSDLVSSVAVISVEDATKVPTTNVAEMLRGKSAGIQVTLEDARPGGESSILIRGKNSILGENDPLFIVDGAPYDNINAINSEDIESLEVLKDAAAQAIYGARASNGVILVTTKRGTTDKFTATYHGFYGKQWVTKNFELYNGDEWAQLRREAYRTDNNNEYEDDSFVFTPTQLEVLESGEWVDWEDVVMQPAKQQNHTLTLSGGSEKTKLYSSFGYLDQEGMIPGSGYKRGTARLNIDQKVNDRLRFGSNIYLLSDRQDHETGTYINFITLPPLAEVYDDDGELAQYPSDALTFTNPLWDIRESTDIRNSNEYSFTLFGEIEILSGLKYKLNAFYNQRNRKWSAYKSTLHSRASSVDGKATLYSENKSEYLVENILTYDKDINADFHFDITLMQSANKRTFVSDYTYATGFPNDILGYDAIASASTILPVEREAWERTLLSYMGRFRLNAFNRYLFTLTERADGSSVFATDNKWAYFPSVAFGWKLHREAFMEPLHFINELKLRASYGSIGNEAINTYQTLGLASEANYVFGDETASGYLPGESLFNPDLKWETSTTFNIGTDFGLINNLFVGSFEFYSTKTTDLLVERTTPGGTGYTKMISNIGETQNRGIELSLTSNIIRKTNYDWSVTLNYSKNKNQIKKLFGEVDSVGNPINDLTNSWFIGEPIDVIFTYQADGIWQESDDIANSHMPNAEPGRIRVADVNNDGEIDADDRVVIHRTPKWIGSLSTNIRIYNFEIYADLYTVQGPKRVNPFLYNYNYGGTLQGTLNGIKVDYWTPENPSTTYPRPRNSLPDAYFYSAAVKDASYVRLRTLSVSYRFPKKIIEPVRIADLTLYATFTNPITWTDYLSYSPENDANDYPDSKSYIIGVKITL